MGAHDFDFLHGSWRVRHRRLEARLTGSTDWAEFGGTMRCSPILAGQGNFDENVIDLPEERYEACTLRLFDASADQWTIHWIDGRDPKLDPPLAGRFVDGIGTFWGEDTLRGEPVRVRFLWSRAGEDSARWEQAFSRDGRDWETNWIMEFVRA